MNYKDFLYDGRRLSDFDSVIVSFSDGGGFETTAFGNELSFQTAPLPYLKCVKNVKATYQDMVGGTIEIGKDPCKGEYTYTENEVNAIMRWLNADEFHDFVPDYDDPDWGSVHFHASFNVSPVLFGYEVVGFSLTVTTDAPFGFKDPVTYEKAAVSEENPLSFLDASAEPGYQYVDMTVKCLSAGDLTIRNDIDPANETCIRNCQEGETIRFLTDSKAAISDLPHETLWQDFNYKYPRVRNDRGDKRENVFTTSLPCDITLTYSPISKASIF